MVCYFCDFFYFFIYKVTHSASQSPVCAQQAQLCALTWFVFASILSKDGSLGSGFTSLCITAHQTVLHLGSALYIELPLCAKYSPVCPPHLRIFASVCCAKYLLNNALYLPIHDLFCHTYSLSSTVTVSIRKLMQNRADRPVIYRVGQLKFPIYLYLAKSHRLVP
jgi:hypothetical protein